MSTYWPWSVKVWAIIYSFFLSFFFLPWFLFPPSLPYLLPSFLPSFVSGSGLGLRRVGAYRCAFQRRIWKSRLVGYKAENRSLKALIIPHSHKFPFKHSGAEQEVQVCSVFPLYKYRALDLAMFKHYVGCATFIFLCIFLVQMLVTNKWV